MADRYGYVMVVPEGLRESWNTGSSIPQGYSEENGIDDLAFVAALVDDVLSTGAVDPSRIYAMGVSKGGMMAYHAACNLPGRFAAIAVVAATMTSQSCPGPLGTSLLHIHGTDDERVPFAGGTGDFSARGQSWPSAYAGIMTFSANAQCGQDWEAQQITADTLCTEVACPGSDAVQYCLVDGGGHTWPGVQTTRRQERQGARSSSLFDATAYIAAFFAEH
jgi:polyhydroxybutyrate depolymerase